MFCFVLHSKNMSSIVDTDYIVLEYQVMKNDIYCIV